MNKINLISDMAFFDLMPQIVIQFDEPNDHKHLGWFIDDIKEAIHYSKWKPENCTMKEEVI